MCSNRAIKEAGGSQLQQVKQANLYDWLEPY